MITCQIKNKNILLSLVQTHINIETCEQVIKGILTKNLCSNEPILDIELICTMVKRQVFCITKYKGNCYILISKGCRSYDLHYFEKFTNP